MNKKFITSFLAITLIAGTMTFTHTNTIYGQTIKSEQTTDKLNENETPGLFRTVQNKYLIQKSDGTFTLDENIYNEFDAEVVNFVQFSMDGINDYIKEGKLKFIIVNNKSGLGKTVINTENNFTDKDFNTRSIGAVISSYNYCSNYQWYFWGYKTKVNKTGAKLLINEYEHLIKIHGAASGVIAAFPGGVGILPGAISAAGGFLTFGNMSKECSNGVLTGKGVNASGVSKPQYGCVTSVTAIY